MSKSAAVKNGASPGGKLLACPRCGNQVEDLLKVDVGMKLSLENEGHKDSYTAQACPKCYTELSGLVSQGAKLRAQKTSKDYNKKVLWKNRVNFLKQGLNLMSIRAYPEAALMYEKYMKSLAVGFETKPTEINPGHFKDPRYRKEQAVMAYVLWDLYKIYDTDVKYLDRQKFVADKIKIFAASSVNLQTDLSRKLDNFTKYTNNKALTEDLLKEIDKNLVRCFIATSAFDSGKHETVQLLCLFRDQILSHSLIGKLFIAFYYRVSPKIAQLLDEHPYFKKHVRFILEKIALRLNQLFDLKSFFKS